MIAAPTIIKIPFIIIANGAPILWAKYPVKSDAIGWTPKTSINNVLSTLALISAGANACNNPFVVVYITGINKLDINKQIKDKDVEWDKENKMNHAPVHITANDITNPVLFILLVK